MTDSEKLRNIQKYMVHSFVRIPEIGGVKVILAFFASLSSLLVDSALQREMEALILLVIADFIIALIANRKNGKAIESAKALKSAIKLFIYLLLIVSAHLAEVSMRAITILDDTMIAFLAATELISIMEHGSAMGMNMPSKILYFLKSYTNPKK